VVRVARRQGTAAAVAALLLALTGCGRAGATAEAHAQSAPPSSAPSQTRWPAGIAGGACLLIEYDEVQQDIGVSFDVSAAGESQNTFTCVLQKQGIDLPDLTLAVTPTAVDSTVFRASVQPKGAAVVANLGRVAYSVTLPPAAASGPVVEVGWLAGNGRLMILRYRSPVTAAAAEATAMVPKLVTLAKQVDLSSV